MHRITRRAGWATARHCSAVAAPIATDASPSPIDAPSAATAGAPTVPGDAPSAATAGAPTVPGDAPAVAATAPTPRKQQPRIYPAYLTFVAEHAHMSSEALAHLPPERQVVLAVMFLRLSAAANRRVPGVMHSAVWLSPVKQTVLFHLALAAVREQKVPLRLSARLVGARTGPRSPMKAHVGELRRIMLARVSEAIVQDALTAEDALELLPMAQLIPRNASVIGNLVEKTLAGKSVTVEAVIRALFAIVEGRVHPPHATLDKMLNKLLQMSASLNSRQVYRLAVAASRIDYPILVRLTPVLLRAWGDMATRASALHAKPTARIAALRRFRRVTLLSAPELANFIRICALVGLRYPSTIAPLAQMVVVPVIRFLRASHLSFLLGSLSDAQCHDPVVYQALANKICQNGPTHVLTLMQLRSVLRAVAAHPDLYRSIRIGGLLELLVHVSNRCGAMRQVQLIHFALDAYQLTRRFARDANVVAVMCKVVEEFCLQSLRMVRVGVAHLSLVNQLLEVTVMMGMRAHPTRYPGMALLLRLRGELYEGVEVDGLPGKYRAMQHADTFALYHHLAAVNQPDSLFRLRASVRAIDRLQRRMVSMTAFHIMHALRLYNVVHGRHLRLASKFHEMASAEIRRKFLRTAGREGGKERFREIMPAAFDEGQVKQLVVGMLRSPIESLRHSPRVLNGVVALALAYGDDETKKLALAMRDRYYAPPDASVRVALRESSAAAAM